MEESQAVLDQYRQEKENVEAEIVSISQHQTFFLRVVVLFS